MSLGRGVKLSFFAIAALLSLALFALNSSAALAAPPGTCTFSPAGYPGDTVCTLGSSLTNTSVASSDGTYWLFVLNVTPADAPDTITACWSGSQQGNYCGASDVKSTKGAGNTTQYVFPENAYNTDAQGNPKPLISAIAVIAGTSSASNFVLGGIPAEPYCSAISGEDAGEAAGATDTNVSCPIAAAPTSVPPTTSAPKTSVAPTTTVAPPVTVASAVAASSAPPAPTTTTVPAARPVAVPVTAASAPPTMAPAPTTTVPAPPATVVVAADVYPFSVSTPQAPPGTAVTVSGGHFGAACSSVVVSLGSDILLRTSIIPGRTLRAHSMYIPGDTPTGQYELSVRCAAGGSGALGEAVVFSVVPQSLHRSGFATSLLLPSQVNFSLKSVAGSLALAGGSIPLVAFPAEFLNAALEDHEADIHHWMGLLRAKLHGRRRVAPDGVDWRAHATLAGVLLATALLYGFLDPRFGLDMTSLALFVGLLAGLAVITMVADIPSIIYLKRKAPGSKLHSHAIPGALLVAFVCVVLSRVLHFEPGYLYGTVAGLRVADGRHLSHEAAGRSSALSAVSAMVLSVLAWLLREPLVTYASHHHATFLAVAAEAALVAVFVAGVQGVLLNMLPLRFLPGSAVVRWSRKAWIAIEVVAFFAFVHLLLGQGSGYVGSTSEMWPALIFVAVVAILTAGVWIFFMRYDAKHPEVEGAEEEEIIGI